MKKTFILAFLMIAATYMAKAQAVTTYPDSVSNCSDSVVITYHPYSDTSSNTATSAPDSTLGSLDTIYVYTWAIDTAGTTYQRSAWGDVPDSTNLRAIKVDRNDYTFTIHNLRQFYETGVQPLPATYRIAQLAVIFRTADGDTQTINNYITLQACYAADTVITTGSDSITAVANINANSSKVSIYPNPTTGEFTVSYSFAQQAATTVRIENAMGQTVMTQNLGNKQSGNADLSVANLPAGMYLVTVSNGSNQIVQRISKQ